MTISAIEPKSVIVVTSSCTVDHCKLKPAVVKRSVQQRWAYSSVSKARLVGLMVSTSLVLQIL